MAITLDEQPKECSLHKKPLEGYCMQDQELLCIDCLLSGDHKSHDNRSIAEAAASERLKLNS